MAKEDQSKDVEEENSSGSSNMIVYGLIGLLFILVIIAMIMAGLGLSNAPETWSWNGNVLVINANVEDVDTGTNSASTPAVTFTNSDLIKTYNILSVTRTFTTKDIDGTDSSTLIAPTLDVGGFTGGNNNKVLRVINNGLKTSKPGAPNLPLKITNFTATTTNSGIASIMLQPGEYAEFLQQKSDVYFMGVSYNTSISAVTAAGGSPTNVPISQKS